MTFLDVSGRGLGRRHFVLLLAVLAVLVSGCSLLSDRDSGEYDTLEAEVAAHKEAIESILEDAFGEYETLGTNVRVGPCGEASSHWSVDTRLIVRPVGVAPDEGVEAMIGLLVDRGLDVGVVEAANGLRPDHDVDIGFFGRLHFYWSNRPEPGILIGLEGSCYSSDRIEAADPWSLNIEEGLRSLVYEQ